MPCSTCNVKNVSYLVFFEVGRYYIVKIFVVEFSLVVFVIYPGELVVELVFSCFG
jgi:hypothetical protein